MRARFPWSEVVVLSALSVALSASLSACGRKGPLEAPPGAITQQSQIEKPDVPATERRNTPVPTDLLQ